jgi:hypothetical protein
MPRPKSWMSPQEFDSVGVEFREGGPELNSVGVEFRGGAPELNSVGVEFREGGPKLNSVGVEFRGGAPELDSVGVEFRGGATELDPGGLKSRAGSPELDPGGPKSLPGRLQRDPIGPRYLDAEDLIGWGLSWLGAVGMTPAGKETARTPRTPGLERWRGKEDDSANSPKQDGHVEVDDEGKPKPTPRNVSSRSRASS